MFSADTFTIKYKLKFNFYLKRYRSIFILLENQLFMNYQLLIESYSFGTSLSEQEIELLSLELETQIMNINISTEFGCFKSAPSHICEGLNLKKDTYWLINYLFEY